MEISGSQSEKPGSNAKSSVNEIDTKHAPIIPESVCDILFNAIVRIELENDEKRGTGFFIKINGKTTNCLFTNHRVVSQYMVNLKESINIFYGKKIMKQKRQ